MLVCKYFSMNVADFAMNVGTWLKYHLQGKKTPTEEMAAAFRRYPELYESLRVTQGRRFAGRGNHMGNVNQIRIVTENDRQYMRMAMNWSDFCKKNLTACEELGERSAHQAPIIDLPKAHAPYKEFKYVLDENGNPAPVDALDYQQLKRTGLINELIKDEK